MNAQIYSFDKTCQTECEGNQKIFWKDGMMKRQYTQDRRQAQKGTRRTAQGARSRKEGQAADHGQWKTDNRERPMDNGLLTTDARVRAHANHVYSHLSQTKDNRKYS
jgi:hypothetical protein